LAAQAIHGVRLHYRKRSTRRSYDVATNRHPEGLARTDKLIGLTDAEGAIDHALHIHGAHAPITVNVHVRRKEINILILSRSRGRKGQSGNQG